YMALRDMIVVGHLQPGEKLKISGLQKRLHTGASPIREALSLLTSDSLVERIDQRGFRAAPINLANFQEILVLRCTLDDIALRASINNRSDAWEEQVILSHHRMTRAKAQASDAFERLHRLFHMTLLANCDSPILLKFCTQLYDLNIRYRHLASRALHYKHRDVADEHAQIRDAVISGDADLASQNLLHHYRATGTFLGEALQRLQT
ncbi:MAG: GntR family transcriptional regulator, partial [Pseudomonadota bacterium]